MPFLSILAQLATHPLVVKYLVPILGEALAKLFSKTAVRVETRAAVNSAKAASTAEQLKEASRKLTDASNRPRS